MAGAGSAGVGSKGGEGVWVGGGGGVAVGTRGGAGVGGMRTAVGVSVGATLATADRSGVGVGAGVGAGVDVGVGVANGSGSWPHAAKVINAADIIVKLRVLKHMSGKTNHLLGRESIGWKNSAHLATWPPSSSAHPLRRFAKRRSAWLQNRRS